MARLTLDGVRQTGLGLLPSRLGRQDNADSAICLACVDSEWVRQSSPNTCTGPHFSPSPAGQILSTGLVILLPSLISTCLRGTLPWYAHPSTCFLRKGNGWKVLRVCPLCLCVRQFHELAWSSLSLLSF